MKKQRCQKKKKRAHTSTTQKRGRTFNNWKTAWMRFTLQQSARPAQRNSAEAGCFAKHVAKHKMKAMRFHKWSAQGALLRW